MLIARVFERFAGLQIQRALNVFVGFRNAAKIVFFSTFSRYAEICSGRSESVFSRE